MDTKTYTRLKKAVLRQLGGGEEAKETLMDVYRNGGDAGYSGFTYYVEMAEFWRKNRKEIIAALLEDADSCGVSVSEMVKAFRCMEDFKSREIDSVIYGLDKRADHDNEIIMANLSIYALEYVAHREGNREYQEA